MLKKKLICNKLIHDLIQIILSTCDEKTLEEYDKEMRVLALACLENLGGIFNRKIFIPGETRELDKIRRFFMAQGMYYYLTFIKENRRNPSCMDCLGVFSGSRAQKAL